MGVSLQLTDYIKNYKSIIPISLLNNLLKSIEQNKSSQHKHQFGTYGGEHIVENENCAMASDYTIFVEKDYDDLKDIVWNCIKKYIDTFAVEGFRGWQGFSPLDFHHHNVGNEMIKHCDHISNLFDGERKGIPTLTIVGVLNDDFEGGEFAFFHEEIEVTKLGQGDIVIFPANFLYPHKVKTVTKGTRHSFVTWVW